MNEIRKKEITDLVRSVFAQAGYDHDAFPIQVVPLSAIISESSELLVAELPNGEALSTKSAVKFLEREIGFEMPDLNVDDRKLSGYLYVAQQASQLRGCILTDNGEPTVRRRFSAAHEFGHYLLHFLPFLRSGSKENLFLSESLVVKDGDEVDGEIELTEDFGIEKIQIKQKAEMEVEADYFAAEMLMPRSSCLAAAHFYRADINKSRKALTSRLSTSLLVSFEAMRRRLDDLQIFGSIN